MGDNKLMNAGIDQKWPKNIPPLTPEQAAISDDFMKYWHEVLPRRYGIVDQFGHKYVVKTAPKEFRTSLEIGVGIGEHIGYEKLNPQQRQGYFGLDIRENMIAEFHKRFPDLHTVVGDCQKRIDFADGYFDRIFAVHVLEHLPNLPAAVREMYRLCNKEQGVLSIVIPCEGSPAYTLARQISTAQIFRKRYNQDISWLMKREHINLPPEIFEELAPYFELRATEYFPFPMKMEFCNLCIGATFKPKRISS